MKLKLVFCILAVSSFQTTFCQRPQVKIQDGELVGITMQTWMGRNMSAFLGVPFAAPPTGKLRFQAPQPVAPWTWPRDAGTYGNQCSQLPYGGPQYLPDLPVGFEDCLYLNVYTPMVPDPNIKNQPLLPVLIYFHGGSFIALNGSAFGPRYLLDYNIILVTTNYRLGVLGFLSSGDSASPGNNGLKDQSAAIKWVSKNIAAFGGDPTQVTLSGTSVGALSVQYHFFSPLSRGLFQRAICQSGSVFMPVAEQKRPLNKFYTFAKLFNCTSNNTKTIVNCLRKITDYSLVEAQRIYQSFNSNPTDVFGPTVERDLPGSFVSQLSYEYVRTGNYAKVPILMTTVRNEGLVPTAGFIANATALSYVNNNWEAVAPYLLDYIGSVDASNLNSVSQAIRKQYFGNQSFTLQNTNIMVQLVGDRSYNDDIENIARLFAYTNTAPVYFGRFTYRGRESATNVITGTNTNYGVSHGDDIMYVFNTTIFSAETDSSDRQMIQVLSGVWANFTIFGTTSVNGIQWKPVQRNKSQYFDYLLISAPNSVQMQTATTFGNPKFWDSLPISEPWAGRPININV